MSSGLHLHAHLCYSRDHSICFRKAVHRNDFETVESLLEAGLIIKMKDAELCFLEAIQRSHLDMAKHIKSLCHVDPAKCTYERKYNAIHMAIRWIRDRQILMDAVDFLLGAGVKIIEQHQRPYTTSAMEAVKLGDERLLEIFLQAGSNVHFIDINNMTMLHYALMQEGDERRLRLVQLLIQKGALELKHCNPYMSFAIKQKDCTWDVLKVLIDAGEELNTLDHNKISPLALAVYKCNYKVVEGMINIGANLNISGQWSNSALEIAMRTCRKDIAMLLLDHGASVTVQDADGFNIYNSASLHMSGAHKVEYLDILNTVLKYGQLYDCRKYYMKVFLIPDGPLHPVMIKWNYLKHTLGPFLEQS